MKQNLKNNKRYVELILSVLKRRMQMTRIRITVMMNDTDSDMEINSVLSDREKDWD